MVNKNLIGRILMFLLLLLTLVVVIKLVVDIQSKAPVTTSGPTGETSTPTPSVERPVSRWATDSAVLEIEVAVKNLVSEVSSVDLKEGKLLPPSLDMEIKF